MYRDMRRGERRDKRERAVKRRFHFYWWISYGGREQWNSWRYSNYEKVILTTNEERYDTYERHRQDRLSVAKLTADNPCNCSCWMCSGHYEKNRAILQDEARQFDDLMELVTS